MATAHTPVGGIPTLVYNPSASGVPHVTLINEGSSPVYIGTASVTAGTGAQLMAGQSLNMPVAAFALYAIAGLTPTATATTLNAAALNSGATVVPVVAGTGLTNGSIIQIGSGSRAETTIVTSGGGSTVLSVSPATLYDHRLSDAVTLMTVFPSTVRTESGAS